MKLYYSRNLMGRRRYSSRIPLFSAILLVLLEMITVYACMRHRASERLQMTAAFAPLLVCGMEIGVNKGKGYHVFLQNEWGKLYLLPPDDFVGRSRETLALLEQRIQKSSILPPEAREIQHTMSLWKIGSVYWLRCVMDGKNRIVNLMFTENYGDWEELCVLLQELE